MDELARLTALQAGTVSRRQLVDAGLADHDVRRLVRRRELNVLVPGVYVDHTGPPSWLQQAWGAVLHAAPAALAGPSALRALAGPGRSGSDPARLHVVVDRARRVRAPEGVVVTRVVDLESQVLWNASPPRQRTEEALLDVAATAADELRAIATLADAVQARLTTARRLADALDRRSRIARRRLLTGVLADLHHGTGSVLEHGYLVGVERAHALPRGERQASVPGLSARHDVLHRRWGLIIELDGRAFHSLTEARGRDLDRDLAALSSGHVTVRLGWGQVFGDPCGTAARVAAVLRQRGWRGQSRRCATCR